jgi:transcriptional regulator with XRE-family HTH domain
VNHFPSALLPLINESLPESNDVPAYGPPRQTDLAEVCGLSIARFPVLARPRVVVNLEPTKMANRSPGALGDFIRRTREEKGLSLEDVSKRSARFGKKIAASYISRIENEPARKVTTHRLAALAKGLGVPAAELLARSAGLVSPGGESPEELNLVTRFRELSPGRKADVLKIVDLWYSEESSQRGPRRRSA